jgi:hypothetical protein
MRISSWMLPHRRNSDGSTDRYISESPQEPKETNRLPAPAGALNVTLRIALTEG